MKLLRSEIKKYCFSSTFQRAEQVYLQKKIIEMEEEFDPDVPKAVRLNGQVRGSDNEIYRSGVLLECDENDALEIREVSCTCPASHSWYGMCKHCAAMCLAYSDELKIRSSVKTADSLIHGSSKTSFSLDEAMKLYSAAEMNIADDIHKGELHIKPFFSIERSYYSGTNFFYVEITAGRDKLYVVKSLPDFIHSVLHGTQYTYGKKLSAYHSFEMFDPISREMLMYLSEAVREKYPNIVSDTYSNAYTSMRKITLNASQAAAILKLEYQRNGQLEFEDKVYDYKESDPPIKLKIKKNNRGGANLSIQKPDLICPEPYALYALGQTIYQCSPEFQRDVLPFLHVAGANDRRKEIQLELAESDFSRFCSGILPRLKNVIEVDEGNVDFDAYRPKKPEFRFYLSGGDDGGVVLRAEVGYGDTAFPLEVYGKEYRNFELEKPVLPLISELFPLRLSSTLRSASREDEVYTLLDSGLERLRTMGEVYIDDSLRSLRWANSPSSSIGVALHGDLIDINVQATGYSAREINDILDAYRTKKKFYRLKSGEFLSLTEGSLSVVAELSDGLDLRYDENGMAQTDAFRAQYINSVLDRDDTELSVWRNSDFKQLVRVLRDYRDSDYELPEGLNATMRGYQRTGYRWLCSLSDCSLGGILADDMGLGKTIQMLSYFLHTGGRALVVCPASLIYNWDSECRRFAPSIETHLVRGAAAQRKLALDAETGLFITSYDQLRRDIELYKDRQFDCCVLDEAQFIRNAGTKAAKAVKQINAAHRFALTGTPIENRLSDLWSIFDFLMPGYLYKYAEFKSRLEQNAVNGDEKAMTALSKMTAPFILRRKKRDVLAELPEKVENVMYVDMTDEQRKLYNAQEQALRLSLQKTSEAEYLHQKIEYLAALTRLRQLCCTPELYLENYSGGSGKVDACIELLTESADSGHRTLVFSQFTSMLDILIARAEGEGLKCLYLSGKNTSEERRDMVNAFQSGEYSVFFISLKAGGTGLNLTAADRVIHFDPWWNFAAEDQATDRTHRIGQKNTVFVTKLVSKDTVEERIIDLQQRKRSLSDMVMSSEALSSGSIDRDELLKLLEAHV